MEPQNQAVLKIRQGSPPSVALSVMLVDYSLDCKGLKGRDCQWAQDFFAPCGKEIYKRTLRVTLADLKATLNQNARAQKDLNHKINVILNIFEYYAYVFVHVIICAALVALAFQFCTFWTFFCPSLSSHFSSIISSWKLPKSAGVFHTTFHVTS